VFVLDFGMISSGSGASSALLTMVAGVLLTERSWSSGSIGVVLFPGAAPSPSEVHRLRPTTEARRPPTCYESAASAPAA
jgi:hypothetical protein